MKKVLLSMSILALVFAVGNITSAQNQGDNQGNGQRLNPKIEKLNQLNEKLGKPNKLNGLEKMQTDQVLGISSNPSATFITQGPTLEKISSPAEMSLFDKIKKVGTDLWGQRKNSNEKLAKPSKQGQLNGSEKPQINQATGDSLNPSATSVSEGSTLEKISSPAEMSLFDKIKKVGTDLWGQRKDKPKKLMDNNSPKPAYVMSIAVQCVKDAIDKKDAALKLSTVSHSQQVSVNIDARGVCQKSALDQLDAKSQSDANKKCVEAFQQGIQDANAIMDKEKNETQNVYREALKVCSVLQAPSSVTSTPQTQEQIMIPDVGAPIEDVLTK